RRRTRGRRAQRARVSRWPLRRAEGHRMNVSECLSAIERLNPKVNAFLHVNAAADGVPIAVKDNIVTTDMPTTCGSKILGTFVSPYDATAIARLRKAGRTIIGKTNLDEFAMGSPTEHPAFGVTRNPWATSPVAGGRPGGAAHAAVVEAGVKGMRFGVVREAVEKLEGDVRQNFDDALRVLRDAGAVVEDASVPAIGYAIAVYYIVANAEASANLARFDGVRYGRRSKRARTVHEMYFASRGEGFGAEVKRRIMLGTFALSSGYYDAYYGRAQSVRARLRNDFTAAF